MTINTEPVEPSQPEIEIISNPQAYIEKEGIDGLLIVAPVGHGSDKLIEELGIFTNENFIGLKACAFLVSGIPGTPTYQIVDLNHLPDSVQVEIRVTTHGRQSISLFQGKTGNQPQAGSSIG